MLVMFNINKNSKNLSKGLDIKKFFLVKLFETKTVRKKKLF